MTVENKQKMEQIQRGEVPKGYKKTRIGIIPEHWDIRQIKEIAAVSSGSTPDRLKDEYWGGNIPWVTTGELDSGRVLGTKEMISSKAVAESHLRVYPKGTLLMAMYGQGKTRGKVAVLCVDATVNQACAAINCENVDTSYLFYFLQRSYDEIRKLSNIGNQENLNANIIKSFRVALPSNEEQKKIVQILSEQDKVIELLDRKIEQLQQLKKYCLAKMFPRKGINVPEIRFPEFSDPWKQHKFSDFTWNAGKRNKDGLKLEPFAITNEHGFIRQSEAHDDFGYMKDTDRRAYIIVAPNSFAYNPARINVGSIGYYEGSESVIVSSLYEVFQTADYIDDRFLWHWFHSEEFPKWIMRLQEGSVRQYFYYDKLCECQMLIPSLPEQKRIAEAINEVDNHIMLHQHKRDEEIKKKKTLMQLLLTGVVRITDL